MRVKEGIVIFLYGAIFATFINFVILRPHPGYESRLKSPCVKCGSPEIQVRYCTEGCRTPCPTLGRMTFRSDVTWGHEHLHRACKACGYAEEALECMDHDQP
jgi:hypothetical protein